MLCDQLEFRTLINSSCMCQIQYFDEGQTKCSKCDPYCNTCTGSAFNQCLSCVSIILTFPNNTCNCQDGYFKSVGISCHGN